MAPTVTSQPAAAQRRRFAGRQFRRSAGDLSQYPRRSDAARRGQALLRVALHDRASCTAYSTGSTTRRWRSRWACRRWCDRTSPARGHVLHRYGNGLRERGAHQWSLWPWRECRSGHGEPDEFYVFKRRSAPGPVPSCRSRSVRRNSSWSTRRGHSTDTQRAGLAGGSCRFVLAMTIF